MKIFSKSSGVSRLRISDLPFSSWELVSDSDLLRERNAGLRRSAPVLAAPCTRLCQSARGRQRRGESSARSAMFIARRADPPPSCVGAACIGVRGQSRSPEEIYAAPTELGGRSRTAVTINMALLAELG